MSRMPYLIDADDARWGHKMGHFPLVDAMYRDGFRCSLSGLIMGETAELLARDYGITREAIRPLRAARASGVRRAATRAGRFDAEIAPVRVPGPKGETTIAADEHPRPGTTIEALAEAAARVPGGRRPPGNHYGGILVRHHRRWRGGDRGWRRCRA